MTNFHVIAGATDLTVTTMDQAIYRARLVGADPDKDVAVLQVFLGSWRSGSLVQG